MDWWASVALAYDNRQVAIQLPEHHQRRRSALANVAQEFGNLAQSPHRAGDSTTCLHLFLNAGECYGAIPYYAASANSFLKAERYTEAAFQYRMAGLFEEATGVVKRYPVDPEVRESVIYAAKVVYTRQGDVESLQYGFIVLWAKLDLTIPQQSMASMREQGRVSRLSARPRLPGTQGCFSRQHRGVRRIRANPVELWRLRFCDLTILPGEDRFFTTKSRRVPTRWS